MHSEVNSQENAPPFDGEEAEVGPARGKLCAVEVTTLPGPDPTSRPIEINS